MQKQAPSEGSAHEALVLLACVLIESPDRSVTRATILQASLTNNMEPWCFQESTGLLAHVSPDNKTLPYYGIFIVYKAPYRFLWDFVVLMFFCLWYHQTDAKPLKDHMNNYLTTSATVHPGVLMSPLTLLGPFAAPSVVLSRRVGRETTML